MPNQFLFEQIDSAKLFGVHKDIPTFIQSNLSSRISLRSYQKDALENTIIYLEGDLSKNKQTHILYHMATGSGKTVIMAMNILYYYSKGYRNFLFFTNHSNIVAKTKINFLEKSSNKYLFGDSLSIGGNYIAIKEVSNFQDSDKDAINICFNTVQGIHSSLSLIKEGSLTIEDFENEKIVLIADEAHHLNSATAKEKDIILENKTWEETVNNIFHANKDNVLLEYTATCDTKDPAVLNKYLDKIVFNFDLAKFREAGYTKEFANFSSNTTKWTKSLQALIMSEYRKLMFEAHGINILPVVLLKSQRIKESKDFEEEFHKKINELSEKEIVSLQNVSVSNTFLKNAFEFFNESKITNTSLINLIQLDFAEANCINMNSGDEVENEKIVNNLDEPTNHYRAIFIVDTLTEGWDVLSLFDIVRLYDTRQSLTGGGVSKYTISEAQLIGRGARYCPFKFEASQDASTRKYSNNWGVKEAICETLLYHCVSESRYIDEIKKALKATGLLPQVDVRQVTYKLKDDFKHSDVFSNYFVFLNQKEEVSRDSVKSLPDTIRKQGISYHCSSAYSTSGLLLSEKGDKIKKYIDLPVVRFRDIEKNITSKTYRAFASTLSFDKLKKQFPQLNSIKTFLYDENYLGLFPITFFVYPGEKPSPDDKLNACKFVLSIISDYVSKIDVQYVGSKKFIGYHLNEKFHDVQRNISRDPNDESWGAGISQNSDFVDSKYRIDLKDKEWYVYDDNYGTSEEKKFVKYFSTIIGDIKEKYDHIYLIRNELEVAIYSFKTGSKFEPDYLLILVKDGEMNEYLNIFIEPKGSHLLDKDSWKNDFLLELEKDAIPCVKFVDDNEYKIWGTPLYNESRTKSNFISYFYGKIIK